MDSYVRAQHLRCKFCLTPHGEQGRLDSSPLPSAKSESAFRPEHIHLLLPPIQDGCILLTIFRLVATFWVIQRTGNQKAICEIEGSCEFRSLSVSIACSGECVRHRLTCARSSL